MYEKLFGNEEFEEKTKKLRLVEWARKYRVSGEGSGAQV